ncbi:MAG: glutamate--tRNA ligase [Rhodospirillaceae bacterium]|jgi:glutamyl-tRNA synthetase|nr:glutamate--tRNA ligase [Rhodospirillaceae bacterium]
MTVITRFAPSPTGFLHIGGARTALFNWLFAMHHQRHGDGGKFLLRIEDTDRKRSTQEAVDAIYDGMKWLGLDWDGEAISQFSRVERHQEVVEEMLTAGHAYKCYCSPEELAEMREIARAEGRKMMYDGRWRDRDASDAPAGVDPVIRLKAPSDGQTVIRDLVQGEVSVENETMDDMVLLRADGTPTYMLAVVVDDHDMAISHVIRGDDHFTNAFRQSQIFNAMQWAAPEFAHIPLIHGADGAKLSKRHGALGVDAYRDMGFLPDAVCNYLLRLGWSHGDEEIISRDQAVEWFGLGAVNKGAARFDMDKLTATNAHYIQNGDDEALVRLIMPELHSRLGDKISPHAENWVRGGIGGLKPRAKTVTELIEKSEIYALARPLSYDEKAGKLLDVDGLKNLNGLRRKLEDIAAWDEDSLDACVRAFTEEAGIKMGQVAQPLRAALTGTTVSPGVFEVLAVFGRDEALGRLDDALTVS